MIEFIGFSVKRKTLTAIKEVIDAGCAIDAICGAGDITDKEKDSEGEEDDSKTDDGKGHGVFGGLHFFGISAWGYEFDTWEDDENKRDYADKDEGCENYVVEGDWDTVDCRDAIVKTWTPIHKIFSD